jgi:hypothetical protein
VGSHVDYGMPSNHYIVEGFTELSTAQGDHVLLKPWRPKWVTPGKGYLSVRGPTRVL